MSHADSNASEPSDETVVQTASDAAEDEIFSAYKQSAIRDYDVTVVFEDGVLEVDVYLNAPDGAGDGRSADQVADEAALAARSAVDELFDE
ncbi:DUF3194 domain-containing protein [Natrialbaceae archaeon A-CW2]|uniref:DUF3194 domain-containing protein n=1 Tax=Natronosalvus amylolyticus TaxID=2961994 RepID=UPI0020C9E1DA|nr:DUF3194 domain-containing protein [Natronosalvus amylolyticus]